MTSFEYKVITTEKGFWGGKDKPDIEQLLNEHGRNNWELVSVVPISNMGGGQTTGLQFFFKRSRF